MIYDNIKNLNKYNEIPANVKDFLTGLSAETPVGHYEIDENIYVNIDIYNTKDIDNCKLEAHKKYIDIQMLIDGSERLDYISVDGLDISEQYDDNRDVMFFELPAKVNSLYLKPGNFALFYPEDAHRPQMNSSAVSAKVKKVVVKILISAFA